MGNDFFKNGDSDAALENYTLALNEDPNLDSYNATLYANRAAALKSMARYDEAISDLNRSIGLDVSYYKAYIRRAQCYIAVEKYEEAVRDYEHVLDKEPTNEVQAGLREAKRLLKISKRKDYYKILGISKTATLHEIKKAYKRLALQYHPDKVTCDTEEEKKQAETKFKEIADAYSILMDANKKARFDAGEDLEGGGDGVDISEFFARSGGFPGGMGGMGGGMGGGFNFPGGGSFRFGH